MGNSSNDYYTKPQLKKRGWTETGIRKFLPYPDKYIDNPVHYRGAPMPLWLAYKVHIVERSDKYKEWRYINYNKKEGAHKATRTKKLSLMAEVDGFEITIPQISMEELIQKALEHRTVMRVLD